LELGHCEPLLSRLTLQGLKDDIKLEFEAFIAHSSFFCVDRVAGPLYDYLITDTVDLAELGQHFLHFVSLLQTRFAFEDVNHLINDLTLSISA